MFINRRLCAIHVGHMISSVLLLQAVSSSFSRIFKLFPPCQQNIFYAVVFWLPEIHPGSTLYALEGQQTPENSIFSADRKKP